MTDPLIDCPTNFSCKLVKEDRRCFPTSSIGQTLEGAACTYNHECKDGLYCQNYFQAKTNTIIAIYKAGETTPLATNDNISSTDRFSKLTQTFATAGTYYITVKSSGSSTGDYKLTATARHRLDPQGPAGRSRAERNPSHGHRADHPRRHHR